MTSIQVPQPPSFYDSIVGYTKLIEPIYYNLINESVTSPILNSPSNTCNVTQRDLNYKFGVIHDKFQKCVDTNDINCVYESLLDDSTYSSIENLVSDVKKLNMQCLLGGDPSKISGEDKALICDSINDMHKNGYLENMGNLAKLVAVLEKYKSLISEIRNYANSHLGDYIQYCSPNSDNVKNAQALLDKLNDVLVTCDAAKCQPLIYDASSQAESACSANIANATDPLNNKINDLSRERDALISQRDKLIAREASLLNTMAESSDDKDSLVWDATPTPRNGWIFVGMILLCIICMISTYMAGKSSKY